VDVEVVSLRELELEPWLQVHVLRFTGIKLTGKHYFGSVVLSPDEKKTEWPGAAYDLGVRASR
jgi:hypothetical protein